MPNAEGGSVEDLKRILYVEDQLDIQMIARVALESISHFELKISSGGEEALQCIEAFSPQLLLLDVMMPGLDGPQTLEQARKLPGFENIPVIFMTAKVLPSEIESLMALGALGVIQKPFDPVSLGDEIRALWDAR